MPSARMSPWDSPKSGLSFEDASRAMMYGSSPCRTCTAQTNHDHCTAPPSAPKASTQQCPHSTRHTCSIGCDQNPVQQTPPTTVRHAPGQRNRSRPARAGRRSACPAGTCTHQLRSRTATRAMFSGKSKIRILIQRGQKAIKWPFDPSGFRCGAKYWMGAPRENDFLCAPLGAGRGATQVLAYCAGYHAVHCRRMRRCAGMWRTVHSPSRRRHRSRVPVSPDQTPSRQPPAAPPPLSSVAGGAVSHPGVPMGMMRWVARNTALPTDRADLLLPPARQPRSTCPSRTCQHSPKAQHQRAGQHNTFNQAPHPFGVLHRRIGCWAGRTIGRGTGRRSTRRARCGKPWRCRGQAPSCRAPAAPGPGAGASSRRCPRPRAPGRSAF